jgi:hypothetical protein
VDALSLGPLAAADDRQHAPGRREGRRWRARVRVRFDIWAISVARFAAALTAIGSFTVSGFASGAAGVMCVSLFVAPSCWQRLKNAFSQPLGQATLLFIAALALAMLWSPVPLKPLLREWIAWRQFAWLFIALALFDDRAAKYFFASVFVVGGSIGAVASYIRTAALGISHGAGDLLPGIVMRNHVTEAWRFASGPCRRRARQSARPGRARPGSRPLC